MDYEAEARKVREDVSQCPCDACWEAEIAAALRRATEEAEVRAFGDRAALVAAAEARERDIDRLTRKLAELSANRAALVAAGDALARNGSFALGMDDCLDEWNRLAHPEKP